MWDNLFGWFRMIWDAGIETQKNSKRIEEMTDQNRESSEAFRALVAQQQHDRELSRERIESLEKEIEALRRELHIAQENTELKLRLAISEYLRQLPPPPPNNENQP